MSPKRIFNHLLNWFYCFFLFISFAATLSDNDIDLDKLKSQIPDGILPPGFNASSLSTTADDAKKLFKEKCQKQSNSEDTFHKVENASEVLRNCLMNLIDIEVLQKEIDEAQPNGDLDTVFNKWVIIKVITSEWIIKKN